MATLSENRKAYFDYQILETLEAGIELKGFEVKAIKAGRLNLTGSFGLLKPSSKGKFEIWLTNADLPPYQPNNTPANYDPKRNRRLLLKSGEIRKLANDVNNGNLRLIPIKAYTERNIIKLELALARPKKKADKRSVLIKKEVKKEIKKNKL